MKRSIKVIETEHIGEGFCSPYQEVAVYVRELLNCDYALVALPGRDAIRIVGFAGPQAATYGNIAGELIAQLREWGPIVVDDARLIAAPVSYNGRISGVLIGYSGRPGTFTAADLETLMKYSEVVAAVLSKVPAQTGEEVKTVFTADDLLHVSGLLTMGQLSACFAHEVATPLTLIRGHLRIVDDSLPGDHPLRDEIKAIDRSARRIEDMAKRMLAFSRKKTRRLERCNVAEIISEALQLVQPYFREKLIEVQLRLQPALPWVSAYQGQLLQVMVNLFQNAADAMANVDKRILAIDAGSDRTDMRIVISDTGTGIDPENLRRIFDPFFTTKGSSGTGLGLYITKQIIEEHRGNIAIETSHRGTSFVISLPL